MNESKNNNIVPQESDFLLYTTPEGNVKIEVPNENTKKLLTAMLLITDINLYLLILRSLIILLMQSRITKLYFI